MPTLAMDSGSLAHDGAAAEQQRIEQDFDCLQMEALLDKDLNASSFGLSCPGKTPMQDTALQAHSDSMSPTSAKGCASGLKLQSPGLSPLAALSRFEKHSSSSIHREVGHALHEEAVAAQDQLSQQIAECIGNVLKNVLPLKRVHSGRRMGSTSAFAEGAPGPLKLQSPLAASPGTPTLDKAVTRDAGQEHSSAKRSIHREVGSALHEEAVVAENHLTDLSKAIHTGCRSNFLLQSPLVVGGPLQYHQCPARDQEQVEESRRVRRIVGSWLQQEATQDRASQHDGF